MGKQQSKSFLTFDSLLAELIVGTEAGRVGVEGVGAIFEDNLEGVDSLAVLVKIVPQIHALLNIKYNQREIKGVPYKVFISPSESDIFTNAMFLR